MPTEAPSAIDGVRIVTLDVYGDPRGRFCEIFRSAAMPETFVQANHSRSAAGVLRGLHYHRHQADLWYVPAGRAQVGLADLRVRGGTPPTESFVLDAAQSTSSTGSRGSTTRATSTEWPGTTRRSRSRGRSTPSRS